MSEPSIEASCEYVVTTFTRIYSEVGPYNDRATAAALLTLAAVLDHNIELIKKMAENK